MKLAAALLLALPMYAAKTCPVTVTYLDSFMANYAMGTNVINNSDKEVIAMKIKVGFVDDWESQ